MSLNVMLSVLSVTKLTNLSTVAVDLSLISLTPLSEHLMAKRSIFLNESFYTPHNEKKQLK